jgi:putative nucleotidyltransferase with HDIG domain
MAPYVDEDSLLDHSAPPLVKAGLLYSSAKAIAWRAIAQPVSDEALAAVASVVSAGVDYLERADAACPALLSVILHNSSAYTHSVNVAIYSLGMAMSLGINGEQDLRALGLGAILHDLGKARVPEEILSKPGPLSSEQWSVMRRHPNWGSELLAASGMPDLVRTIINQHHERMDGSGYPLGISGDQIHPFSAIVALADSYDAMTCNRPYRPACAPFDALLKLKGELVLTGKLKSELFIGLARLLGDTRRVLLS